MKKVLALVLTLALVASFAVSSFAADKQLFAAATTTWAMRGVVDKATNTLPTNYAGNVSRTFTYNAITEADLTANVNKAPYTALLAEYNAGKAAMEYYDLYVNIYGLNNTIMAGYTATGTVDAALKAAVAACSAPPTDPEKNAVAAAYIACENAVEAYKSCNLYVLKNSATLVSVTSSDTTYCTVDSFDPSARTFKLNFTNTTFATKTVDVTLKFAGVDADGNNYSQECKYTFNVDQAQTGTFDKTAAQAAWAVTNDAEINAANFATIKKEAFDYMLKNSKRTLTVVFNDGKIKFDASSFAEADTCDMFIAGIKTKDDAETVSLQFGGNYNIPVAVKLAVGKEFYNNYYGKKLAVNGSDAAVILQGDYTVNFKAPLASYTVGAAAAEAAAAGKTNPSMGSNDYIAAAVALASLSLCAAGAVALKKSK